MSAKQEAANRVREVLAQLVEQVNQAEQLGLQVVFIPSSKFSREKEPLQVEISEITNY